MRYHLSMVRLDFDESADDMQCEGCGASLPAFLDGCPYCDGADSLDDDTLPCPLCGVEVFQDAQKCPSCGGWITATLGTRRKGSWMLVAILVVALIVLAFWMQEV